jgi:hypothetical protein
VTIPSASVCRRFWKLRLRSARKFVESLDALNAIDPVIFGDWQVMDFPARSSFSLEVARARITSIIERNVSRGDLGDPTPVYGYTANAFTQPVAKSRRVCLWIMAGGIEKSQNFLKTGDWKSSSGDRDLSAF